MPTTGRLNAGGRLLEKQTPTAALLARHNTGGAIVLDAQVGLEGALFETGLERLQETTRIGTIDQTMIVGQ